MFRCTYHVVLWNTQGVPTETGGELEGETPEKTVASVLPELFKLLKGQISQHRQVLRSVSVSLNFYPSMLNNQVYSAVANAVEDLSGVVMVEPEADPDLRTTRKHKSRD
jgi:hypothetical protein